MHTKFCIKFVSSQFLILDYRFALVDKISLINFYKIKL